MGMRTCPGCGSFAVTEILLCAPCASLLRSMMKPTVTQFGPVRVRSLYDWNPHESDLLSRFLMALKGPYQARAWQACAWDFVMAHELEKDPRRDQWIVPAPPQKPGQNDHAGCWGESLAAILHVPMRAELLERNDQRIQKHLSREERLARRHPVKLSGSAPECEGLALIVDDVITTGSTVDAIHRVLGRDQEAEAWVLARRTTFLAERLSL